jgi:D-cysteine desulfhydrase
LGFHVALGLFYQPVTEQVRTNLLLLSAHHAEMLYAGPLWKAFIRFYITERIRRPGAFFIEPGGSGPLGTLGYVDAGLELAMQVERGELPLPKLILVPVGTCGTISGLALGLRLSGLEISVMGVQVAPGPFASSRAVVRRVQKTSKMLQRHDPSVPEIELVRANVPVNGAFYGRGYGHPTALGREALELMSETEGIDLDLTYTSKTLAALLNYVKTEAIEGPILFWNTFNSVDLSPALEKAPYKALPRPFHRFFEDDAVNS